MALASASIPLKLARGQHGQVLLFKKTTGCLTVTLTRSSKVHGQIRYVFFSFAKLCTKQKSCTAGLWMRYQIAASVQRSKQNGEFRDQRVAGKGIKLKVISGGQ